MSWHDGVKPTTRAALSNVAFPQPVSGCFATRIISVVSYADSAVCRRHVSAETTKNDLRGSDRSEENLGEPEIWEAWVTLCLYSRSLGQDSLYWSLEATAS